MAKTRIKTTPTRMQKEALTASAAVNSTNPRIVTEHGLKKRLCALNHSMIAKDIVPIQSTIIVQPPKRTNSISSATSTISHTSDGHSSVESPPPTSSSITPTNSNGPTMDELTENAIKTLNAGLLAKTNALALKNRKVYMITEKCDDVGPEGLSNGGGGNAVVGATGGAQKRKMYLIMEEKDSADMTKEGQTEKFMKSECNNGTKKLTLFTDTTNGQLPQKIEKILPEIINCIQAKGAGGGVSAVNGIAVTASASTAGKTRFMTQEVNGKSMTHDNESSNIRLKPEIDKTERLPLTLPPKKNRTKIITTQIIPVNQYHPPTMSSHNSVDFAISDSRGPNGSSSSYPRTEKSSATPVIVNATTLMANGNNGAIRTNVNAMTVKSPTLHKNINLSTDFLFLMKMLPKLESIDEPHKNYVKSCIEDIINQYAPQPFSDDQ